MTERTQTEQEDRTKPLVWDGITYLESREEAEKLARELAEKDSNPSRYRMEMIKFDELKFFYEAKGPYNPSELIARLMRNRMKNKASFIERLYFLGAKENYYDFLSLPCYGRLNNIREMDDNGDYIGEGLMGLLSGELRKNDSPDYPSYILRLGLGIDSFNKLIQKQTELFGEPVIKGWLKSALKLQSDKVTNEDKFAFSLPPTLDGLINRESMTEIEYNNFLELVKYAHSLYEQEYNKQRK